MRTVKGSGTPKPKVTRRHVKLVVEGEPTIDGSTCIIEGALHLPDVVPVKGPDGTAYGHASRFKREEDGIITAVLSLDVPWPEGLFPAVHVSDVKIGVAEGFEWDRTIQEAHISAVGFGSAPAWEKLQ